MTTAFLVPGAPAWLIAAWERWKQPIWLGLSVVGLLAVPYIVWVNRAKETIIGFDAYSTYIIDLDDLYGIRYMDLGSFRYSPAYAQAFDWVGALPWEVFAGIWISASLLILAWWGRRWTLALLALPPVALEIYHGNIHLFMALAMVIGFRYPAAWAFPLLSKVTPGVALLWFVGARQWRNLAIAIGVTGAIAAVSFVLAPHLWAQFAQVSYEGFTAFVPPRRYPIDIPFTIRAPIAAAIALWGGWTNRRWTVPVAAVVALPIVWIHGLTMLLAIIPILREDVVRRATEPALGRDAVRGTAGSAGSAVTGEPAR